MLHCEYCYFLGSGAAPCCICGSDSFLTDDCLRVTVVGTYDDLGAVSAPLELLRQLLGDSMFRRSDSRNSGLIEIGQLPGYRPDKIGLAIRLIEVEPDLPAADIQALANSDATAILMPLQLDRRFDEVVGFIRSPEAKAALTSRVVWTDGRPHPMNTPRVKPFARESELRAAAAARCQPIRSASFVSVLVDAAVTARRGLPQADYFLWNDDFEFTTRLLRGQAGLLCPASVVVHKTAAFGGTDNDPGPRFFYEVRNKIWTLRTGAALTPAERVMYGGSTLRRWARTFAKSGDRRALGSALARGAVAGVGTRPRPTQDVLADVGLPGPPAPPGERDGRRTGRALT